MLNGAIFLLVLLAALAKFVFRIIQEYERGVIFFLGRLDDKPRKPGLCVVIPWIQRLVIVDQRTVTLDVPPQDVITRDNVSVKVNAVLYYHVVDVNKAVSQVYDYNYATSQLAQTTLRSVCGEVELDELLTKREEINQRIQEIVDKQTDPWGIKVSLVELKHIDLPQEMQRAMARQAEAERERRAKIIQAEGEFQASEKLKDAAAIMAQEPLTLQLRYLETLKQISTEQHSTVLFPIPLEMMRAFGCGKKE